MPLVSYFRTDTILCIARSNISRLDVYYFDFSPLQLPVSLTQRSTAGVVGSNEIDNDVP